MTEYEKFEAWLAIAKTNRSHMPSISDLMFETWQAAKAQAVPEVNKDLLQSLHDMVEIVGANFCSNQDVKRKYRIARELLEQNK